MREDASAKKHLVQQLLPQEIERQRRHVRDLEEIASSNATASLLNRLKERLSSVNREINSLMEKKMLMQGPSDDKLSIFRQNVRKHAVRRAASFCPDLDCKQIRVPSVFVARSPLMWCPVFHRASNQFLLFFLIRGSLQIPSLSLLPPSGVAVCAGKRSGGEEDGNQREIGRT